MSDAKRKVLLVEDEEDIALVVRKRLEMAGFEVSVARDGEEALEKAKALPDLIILDLMLPKRSGLYVCTTLRKEQPYDHIPIILHTAKGDEDTLTSFRSDDELLKQWGADGYVQKLDGIAALLDKVKILLAKPRHPSPPPTGGGSTPPSE